MSGSRQVPTEEEVRQMRDWPIATNYPLIVALCDSWLAHRDVVAAQRDEIEQLKHDLQNATDAWDYNVGVVAAQRAALRPFVIEITTVQRRRGYVSTRFGVEAYDAVAAVVSGTPEEPKCRGCVTAGEGTLVAALDCPIHGIGGTDPGDILPSEYGTRKVSGTAEEKQ